jgi:menaquinone-dependent protoporphyrinogen oxidase
MSTAIIYTTNHGTTETVARKIKDRLNDTSVELIDLKNRKHINPSDYNKIILGASIHAGQIQRRVKKFIQKYEQALLQNPLGLFLSCMDEEKAREQFNNAFPESLRNHAKSRKLTGGEFKTERMSGIEKFMVKKVAGITESVSNIKEDKIEELAAEMSKI